MISLLCREKAEHRISPKYHFFQETIKRVYISPVLRDDDINR